MAKADERSAVERRPSTTGLLMRQVGYQLRVQVRSPIGSFATLVVPLMVLLAVSLLFRGTHLSSRGGIRFIQFFTPAMVAFAVVNACYMSVISSTTLARDAGILKRVRSTPLPAWIYMAGRVIAAGLIAVASSVVVIAVGAGVYGFAMVWPAVLPALAVLSVAIFCFCAMGLAVTILVARADSALPVAWGTMLPLCFISDVFQPIDGAPHWLRTVASAFPLRPFADELESLFNPVVGSLSVHVPDLLLMAAWGIGAAAFALLAFRWEPGGAGGHSFRESVRLSRRFAPERLGEALGEHGEATQSLRAHGAGADRAAGAQRPDARQPDTVGTGLRPGRSRERTLRRR